MTGRESGDLVVVADATELAHALAARVAEAAAQAIAGRGRFDVALSGGSTPKAAYALLASEHRERVPWAAVRFFFGDERCVPPDDEESNFRMARLAMFDPLGIINTQIFRMHAEDEPEMAAAEYAKVLERELGANPVFDLVMLGMGPDGHTASLFPGSAPVDGGTPLVLAPWVEKFHTYRLTVAPRVINAARAVIVATAGDEKADALAHALNGPFDTNTYPIQIVRPISGALTWLVDKAAASKLG